MQSNFSDRLAALVHKKDHKIDHKLSTFFKAGEGPHATSVGSKGEHVRKLAKDTATAIAESKRVASALKLAEDVSLFDSSHVDIKN